MTVEEITPSSEPVEVTTTELLQLAMQMHREKRLTGAEKCYRSLLEIEPNNTNALHYLGILLHQTGRNEDAILMIQQSLDQDPDIGPWYNNLGNILLATGRYEAAGIAYNKCSELDTSNLEVLNNLGVLYTRLNQPEKAMAFLERAVEGDSKFISAHANLANVLSRLDRMEEAFSHMADAVALGPQDPVMRSYLVMLYCHAGRVEDGKKECLQWLLDMPGDPRAQHTLAALGGASVPDRASDAYVEREFDSFAVSFDAKLASLEYKAPQLVGQTVSRLLPVAKPTNDVLDIGCGTGLCGPYLKPYSKALTGIDLSTKMLELAKARNLYGNLFKAELVHYLTLCDDQFDLAVSADTLCYFGHLDDAFIGVRRVLRPGGFWVFTVEAHAHADNFQLQLHGRYSHARTYLEKALLSAGFQNLGFESVVLRFENTKPVNGWLVNAQVATLEPAPTESSDVGQSNEILATRSTLQ
jgi:predicted TPR repeat methyltransferase